MMDVHTRTQQNATLKRLCCVCRLVAFPDDVYLHVVRGQRRVVLDASHAGLDVHVRLCVHSYDCVCVYQLILRATVDRLQATRPQSSGGVSEPDLHATQ